MAILLQLEDGRGPGNGGALQNSRSRVDLVVCECSFLLLSDNAKGPELVAMPLFAAPTPSLS